MAAAADSRAPGASVRRNLASSGTRPMSATLLPSMMHWQQPHPSSEASVAVTTSDQGRLQRDSRSGSSPRKACSSSRTVGHTVP